jgi:hypothetical protein
MDFIFIFIGQPDDIENRKNSHFGEAIRRIHGNGSLAELFEFPKF